MEESEKIIHMPLTREQAFKVAEKTFAKNMERSVELANYHQQGFEEGVSYFRFQRNLFAALFLMCLFLLIGVVLHAIL